MVDRSVFVDAREPGSPPFASWWEEFVEPDIRLRSLLPFLSGRIAEKHRVIDLGAGIGLEATALALAGRNVTANEVDGKFRALLGRRSKSKSATMEIANIDWRCLDSRWAAGSFDAALLLGNSFCLLSTSEDRQQAANGIASLLRPGGVLCIDQRNFDRIAAHGPCVNATEFNYSRRVMYCGTAVEGYPSEVATRNVRFVYERTNGERLGHLDMHPFRGDELARLLESAGLSVQSVHFDLDLAEAANCDFLTFVAVRD